MLYQFKKWFFDFNSGTERYAYFFLVEIRFLWFRWYSLTFHHYQQDSGTVTLTKYLRLNIRNDDWENLQISGRELNISHHNDEVRIAIDFDDLIMALKISGLQDIQRDGGLVVSRGRKMIRWYPVSGLLHSEGYIKTNGFVWNMNHETAYADALFSDVLPFLVPVKKMYWGRLADGDLRISYSVVFSDGGNQMSRCYVTWGRQQMVFSDLTIRDASGFDGAPGHATEDQGYILKAGGTNGRLMVRIDHQAVVADGNFIDPDQYRFRMLVRLLGKISKNPGGRKFISRAEVRLETGEVSHHRENVTCADEYVVF